MKDFFVSYNHRDRAWAEWIAWTLEDAGYSTVIQAWDFRAGGNFVLNMQRAASEAKQTIAVLSETYLTSEFTQPEWAAAFAQDPTGKHRTLIPVRVKECQPLGLLRPIVYIDLVDVAEAEAQDILLRSLLQDRAKPDQPPRYPGDGASQGSRSKPVFPPNIPSNLPLASAIFIGRDDELERLHTQLQAQATVAISAVSGMGGIGKTELAAQYALQQRDMGTYPGGICWLRAREDLSTQIVLFARSHLGLSIPEDLELPEQVSHCWRNWHPGETLIVLDDVQQYDDIAPVLPPQRSQFRVLLTTRLTLQSPVQDFEIKVLSEEKAIELLRAIVTDGRIDQDLAIAKLICQWLGHLPLGLELVGRYLFLEPDLSLNEMFARLQQERLQQEALVRNEHDPMWTSKAERGVAAAFELSWQKLEVAAQQLGEMLSLFALAPIPWELVEKTYSKMNGIQHHRQWEWQRWLQKLWQKSRSPQPEFALNCTAALDKARRSLLGLHLLQRNGEQVYELHPLLREFFAAKREQMAAAGDWKRAFCQVMVVVGKQILQQLTLAQMEQVTSAMPHLQNTATTLVAWLADAEVFELPYRIGWFYEGQFDFAAAEQWYQHGLDIAKTRLGTEHLSVATGLNNLASLYHAQERYEEAEPFYLRSLNIRERRGVNHPDVANSLNNLAELYRAKEDYDKAEPFYLRSLNMYERMTWYNYLNFVPNLNNRLNLSQIKALIEQLESERDLNVALSLNNLAIFYQTQKDYSKAEPHHLQSLNIRERRLNVEHPTVAQSLGNLAELYRAKGDYEKVEPLYTRARDIYERTLGANHPNLATILNNLAGFYESQERYDEAEPLHIRALDIRKRRLGVDHPDVANSLINLAQIYRAQKRYSQAEPLYLQALDILENRLGKIHPKTQTEQKRFQDFLEQVMQARQTAQLSKHSRTQSLLQERRQRPGKGKQGKGKRKK